jgi:hypothetical protein
MGNSFNKTDGGASYTLPRFFVRHRLRQKAQIELDLIAHHRDQELGIPVDRFHAATESIELP